MIRRTFQSLYTATNNYYYAVLWGGELHEKASWPNLTFKGPKRKRQINEAVVDLAVEEFLLDEKASASSSHLLHYAASDPVPSFEGYSGKGSTLSFMQRLTVPENVWFAFERVFRVQLRSLNIKVAW